MTVYIVERGEYSDREVMGIFSAREKAVAFIQFDINRERYQDAYEISKLTIDEPKVMSDNDMFCVTLEKGIWDAEPTERIGWRELGDMYQRYIFNDRWSGVFFAKDKEHAIKMGQDAFAKAKAARIGL